MPPQHGAWAMLALPFVLGTWAAGWSWWCGVLLVAWLSGYLLSYFALLAIKTRRPRRYRAPLSLYGGTLLVTGAVCALHAPWLLLAAAGFAVFFAVNAWFARMHNDRHWFNGVVSATAASLMVLVAFGFASDARSVEELRALDWQVPTDLFDLCWLYLVGSVLFVKTMIREAGSRQFLWWSIGFHALALLVVFRISTWLLIPFGWYLARAALLPRVRLRPAYVGGVELVNMVMLVGFSVAVVM